MLSSISAVAFHHPLSLVFSETSRRRATAEEVLAQRSGKTRVTLWINDSDDSINNNNNHNNRRGSHNASDDRSAVGGGVAISKRYHARMDAGVLSDEEDSDRQGHYTQSCSSEESATG